MKKGQRCVLVIKHPKVQSLIPTKTKTFAPHPHQHLFVCLLIVIFTRVRHYLIVLICISLMTNDEYFSCVLLWTIVFRSFVHFYLDYLHFIVMFFGLFVYSRY